MLSDRQYAAALDLRFAEQARELESLNSHVAATIRRMRKLETQRRCMRRLRAARKAQ